MTPDVVGGSGWGAVIVGIGVDVVDIGRLESALARTPGLRDRVFTDAERELPIPSLAARFAAKEAVAKALGAPPGLLHRDAEITPGAHGRPVLRVTGRVAEVAAELGVRRWHVSLTHDGGVAIAYVVAEG
ncbi:holo-ACP synthase [Sphaerisporangium sp. TRM90804]|uniref:holo-ACP synthase n=1 Tax=Sphaerisporangium sp. TRM90804 TaxID=3031113 RepID=UPI00244C35EE|nr:holo-ACP synthase [Sphaerisporangium sp. TRM90804]MDH2423841.1 holo-ACP synthase [Sphaerisporangium sp. TRM90804]